MLQEDRTPLQILKDRRGPIPAELMERLKKQNAAKSAIKKVLAAGPKTVPQIAEITALTARQVFWLLMSMRKYGQIQEEAQEGDYFRYGLVKEEKSS